MPGRPTTRPTPARPGWQESKPVQRFKRDESGKRVLPRGRFVLVPQDDRLVKHLCREAIPVLNCIPNQRHRARSASFGTQHAHRGHVHRFLRWTVARGYKPPHLTALKQVYLDEYLAFLSDPKNGYRVAYQRNVFTSLRLFYEVGLRKTNFIKEFHDYFGAAAVRHGATRVDLSVSGQVDASGHALVPEHVIERVRAHRSRHAERVAAVLGMCLTLGLRVSEALCMRPKLELERLEETNMVEVRRQGSKGGRARTIYFMGERESTLRLAAERALLDAAEMCHANNDTVFPTEGQLGKLRRARQRTYDTLRRAGIDHRRLGISPHSFRHEFVKRCWAAAGHLRPLDGPIAEADRTAAGLAALEVWRQLQIERLGHSKLEKTDAYVGPAAEQARASGVSRAQKAEAALMLADIPKGSIYALTQRLFELQALPYERVREQVLRNLEDKRITPLELPAEFRIPAALAYCEH